MPMWALSFYLCLPTKDFLFFTVILVQLYSIFFVSGFSSFRLIDPMNP